jgi:hypothetical protein
VWQRRLSLIIISLILIPIGLVYISPREWQAATLWRLPHSRVILGALTGDVIVKAKPAWLEAPTNFTATVATNNQIALTWTKNAMATNTLIRAKMGSAPTSITDGWQVYHGPASNFSDNAVSVDETWIPIYYAAWSDNVTDYSTDYVTDDAGAEQVTGLVTNFAWLLSILVIALLNALALWQRHVFIYLIMVPANIVFGLRWAATDAAGGANWVTGVVIAILGVFYLFRVLAYLVKSMTRR